MTVNSINSSSSSAINSTTTKTPKKRAQDIEAFITQWLTDHNGEYPTFDDIFPGGIQDPNATPVDGGVKPNEFGKIVAALYERNGGYAMHLMKIGSRKPDGTDQFTGSFRIRVLNEIEASSLSDVAKLRLKSIFTQPGGAFSSTWELAEMIIGRLNSISKSLKDGLGDFSLSVNKLSRAATKLKSKLNGIMTTARRDNDNEISGQAGADFLTSAKDFKEAVDEFYAKYGTGKQPKPVGVKKEVWETWNKLADEAHEQYWTMFQVTYIPISLRVEIKDGSKVTITGTVTLKSLFKARESYLSPAGKDPNWGVLEINWPKKNGVAMPEGTKDANGNVIVRENILRISTTERRNAYSDTYGEVKYIEMQNSLFKNLGKLTREKDTQGGSKDYLSIWMNGGTPAESRISGSLVGLDALNTSLSHQLESTNTELNSKGQVINSIYSQTKEFIQTLIDFYRSMVRNQIR